MLGGKLLYRIIKIAKNLAILGFLVSYLLPVEENIPVGFLAALVSLTELVEEFSFIKLWGFLPNILVSYLILKAHKIKDWSFLFLLIYSIVTVWGCLLWVQFPNLDVVLFWKASLREAQEKLLIGYWLWSGSIVSFVSFCLIENLWHKLLSKKNRQVLDLDVEKKMKEENT